MKNELMAGSLLLLGVGVGLILYALLVNDTVDTSCSLRMISATKIC